MTPFSNNIVFFDAEFTDLHFDSAELISLAFAKPTGEELYLELEYTAPVSKWVAHHVVPFLKGEKKSQEVVRREIRDFIGEQKPADRPFLVAHVNQYDMAFWHRLFDGEEEPVHRVPIDFASMLFAHGLNPRIFSEEETGEDFLRSIGIDPTQFQKHNSMDDVRLLKAVYEKMIEPK
jgi:hypothetical protein